MKEFMRVKGVNKPYTGGIGSYVLIIMVYTVLKNKGVLGNANVGVREMLYTFANYLSKEF